DRAVKIPLSLVREYTETVTHAQHAWREARQSSDFASFAPWLERIVDLVRQKADHVITPETADRYDALLEEYEPGAKAADIERAFRELRAERAPLIREVAAPPKKPDGRVLETSIPIHRQVAFNSRVAGRVGFDF